MQARRGRAYLDEKVPRPAPRAAGPLAGERPAPCRAAEYVVAYPRSLDCTRASTDSPACCSRQGAARLLAVRCEPANLAERGMWLTPRTRAGIPSSNEVADINRRAKAQNDERRAYQETEALSVSPSSPRASDEADVSPGAGARTELSATATTAHSVPSLPFPHTTDRTSSTLVRAVSMLLLSALHSLLCPPADALSTATLRLRRDSLSPQT